MKTEIEIFDNINFLKNRYHQRCLSPDTTEQEKKIMLAEIDMLIWVVEL